MKAKCLSAKRGARIIKLPSAPQDLNPSLTLGKSTYGLSLQEVGDDIKNLIVDKNSAMIRIKFCLRRCELTEMIDKI
jgi:hypothetical protein